LSYGQGWRLVAVARVMFPVALRKLLKEGPFRPKGSSGGINLNKSGYKQTSLF